MKLLILPLTLTLILACKNYNKETQKKKEENRVIASVKIGDQIWMTENLDVTHFKNGDPIFHAKTAEEWEKAGRDGTPAWCNESGISENSKLYNWYAVNDGRGLAPHGWYVPTFNDWKKLINYLGEGDIDNPELARQFEIGRTAAIKLKSSSGWKDKNGSNSSGFNAVPNDKRYENGTFGAEILQEMNMPNLVEGKWWTSTDVIVPGEITNFAYSFGTFDDRITYWGGPFKSYGLSVRCKKD
jgi:uncharacterized protein (TIGR02145 family)